MRGERSFRIYAYSYNTIYSEPSQRGPRELARGGLYVSIEYIARKETFGFRGPATAHIYNIGLGSRRREEASCI